MLRAFSLLAALTLAGCASDEADVPPPPEAAPVAETAPPEAPASDHGSAALADPTTYTCRDGGSFTVAPVGGGAVEVTLEGETQTLQPAEGKEGVYGGGPLEVWIADEGAFVVQDGAFTLTDCKELADA